MAESWRDRKGLVAALAVLAFSVWGAVGVTVFQATGGDDGGELAAERPLGLEGGPVEARVPDPYVGTLRDPFAPVADVRRRVGTVTGPSPARETDEGPDGVEPAMSFDEALAYSQATPPPPPDPPWQLRGLVGDRALFEGPNGESVLVLEGDRLGETLVYEVRADVVTLRYEGYDFLYDAPRRGGQRP